MEVKEKTWFYCEEYVTEPRAVLYGGDVIDVDGFVHVICGKVICWNPGVIDVNDAAIMHEFIEFARDYLYVDPTQPRTCGDGNVLFLVPLVVDGSCEVEVALTDHHISELPDALQYNIRKFCPYYAEHGV